MTDRTDLTDRTLGGLLVLGRAGATRHRAPVWRVRCLRCGREYESPHTSVVKRPEACRECVGPALGRRAAARNLASGHVARLTRPVWPRVCRACGLPFAGTARQVYCRVECRPGRRAGTTPA